MTALVRLMILFSAVLASCLTTVLCPAEAIAAPSVHLHAVYTYDGGHHTAPSTGTATEGGPPAVAYDYAALQSAVAHGSRGAFARPQRVSIWTYTGYGHTVRFMQSRSPMGTTGTASQADIGALSSIQRSRAAANTGPRMLGVGPWGQRVVDARSKLPGSWGPGVPNKKGVGTRWFDLSNPGNGVRIDQGFAGSPQLSQQVDHVVVRSGGKVIGPDGKPIVGSLSDNPQAHIPLTDWMSWSSWSAP